MLSNTRSEYEWVNVSFSFIVPHTGDEVTSSSSSSHPPGLQQEEQGVSAVCCHSAADSRAAVFPPDWTGDVNVCCEQIIVRDKPSLCFKADEAASVLSNQPEITS